jgi:formiminotetrahydrofolate cyclodeaminase
MSTAAQSAAALVAILGGFMITRVIPLASERAAAQHRVEEIHAELNDIRSRLQSLREKAFRWDADDFFLDAIRDLVTTRG